MFQTFTLLLLMSFAAVVVRPLSIDQPDDLQVLRTVLSESDDWLMIHAKGNERECSQTKEKFCKMFRYEIDASLNTSLVDLWIYKLEESPESVKVSVSFISSFHEEKFLGTFHVEEHEKPGWKKVSLPPILLPTSQNDMFTYQVEINGEDKVQLEDLHRPFLVVSKPYPVATRRRRDVNCDSNESCCLQPLTVSLEEIGFKGILHPDQLEINICAGTCRMDQVEPETHYEAVMTKLIKKDSALQELLGKCWAPCCKPKELEAVRVLYSDREDLIHDGVIPDLSVKSCSCSSAK